MPKLCLRWLDTPGSQRYIALAVGGGSLCAVQRGGRVECWGLAEVRRDVPARNFVSVDVGREHACGRTEEGTVLCWGAGPAAELPAHLHHVQLSAVTTGHYHSCALEAAGRYVHCWGEGLGAGRTPAMLVPEETAFADVGVPNNASATPGGDGYDVLVTSRGQFLSIDAGAFHTCGVKVDHSVSCWGDNTQNQTVAPPNLWVRAVNAGGWHSCAVDVLGMGERVRLTAAIALEEKLGDLDQVLIAKRNLALFEAIEAKTREAARASNNPTVKNTTRVVCWGDQSKSRLLPPPAPQQVPMGSSTTSHRHFFGGLLPFCETSPSNPYCAGAGHHFDGNTADFRAVFVGGTHTCVLLGDDDDEG